MRAEQKQSTSIRIMLVKSKKMLLINGKEISNIANL